jgi:hypothetical protein
MYKLIGYYDYDNNLNKVGELKVEENVVLRLSDNAYVYFNEDSRHYQEYLKWLAEGNTPEPADQGE